MYLYITASLTSYKWPCAHCNAGSNIYTIPTDHDYSLGYFVEFRFYNMRFNRGTFLNGELAPSSRPCLLFDVLVLSFFLSFFYFFFFFLPMPIVLPRICSHVPIKGGSGSYIPIRGAPIPR